MSSNTTETMTEQETHHVKNKEKCLEKGGSYYERNKKSYVKQLEADTGDHLKKKSKERKQRKIRYKNMFKQDKPKNT